MKISLLTGLGVVAFWAVSAQAQIAAYGKLDLVHYSDNLTNNAPTFYGGGLGIYDDFIHLGPLRAGLDLRGDLAKSSDYDYRSAMVGARVAVKAPILPYRPYVQGSVGAGGTKSKNTAVGINAQYQGRLTWEVFGGVDFALLPHIDFRVVEVGFGKQSSATGVNYSGGPSLVSVSSGLVVRFW
jgi:hypothetical protein